MENIQTSVEGSTTNTKAFIKQYFPEIGEIIIEIIYTDILYF